MPWNKDATNAGFSTGKPWLPIPGEHAARAVSVQDGQAESVLMHARELIELRRSSPALRMGNFLPLPLPAPLLGFDRQEGQSKVRCLFNLSSSSLHTGAFVDGECLFRCGDVDHAGRVMGPWSSCITEMPASN
jgi:alpha-glucosidase